MDSSTELGHRLRELRSWRKLSVRAMAELSGISYGYYAKIERGEKPVDSRQLLEAFASTLRVSPAELAGKPYAPANPADSETRAALITIEDVLTGWSIGESPDRRAMPWHEITANLTRLQKVLRPRADFDGQAAMLPELIRELLAAVTEPEHRQDALLGLLDAYKTAAYLAHDLGTPGLPTLAVERMRQAAEELDDPTQRAEVMWRRAHLLSGANRTRQYELAAQVADASDVMPHMRGMANLTAALASASLGRSIDAATHLDEADAIAHRIDTDDQPWRLTDFGRTNVAIWRVAIGVELGEGARVAEVATQVRPSDVPPHRQAAFWMDYGRGLLTERASRDRGVAALLQAERIAPQKTRNNVFVRQAVAGLLGSARGDAAGRELRGLAWRLGVAPTG
jgi:transcriptional regulator with XRE-family HTH domain